MAGYRLYHLKNGRFFHFDAPQAADDESAIAQALGLLGSDAAELWAGRRFVRRFEGGEGERNGDRAVA